VFRPSLNPDSGEPIRAIEKAQTLQPYMIVWLIAPDVSIYGYVCLAITFYFYDRVAWFFM